MSLDLSSFDSIRSFATRFEDTKLPLHILMYALMSILSYVCPTTVLLSPVLRNGLKDRCNCNHTVDL
jgi:hypothetical protein